MASRAQAAVAAGSNSSGTLDIDRVFDAPRALVWAAWTSAEMLVRWLGPDEWPAISASQDFVVGGRWSAVLQDRSGRMLEQAGEYREIVPLERLVFTFKWIGDHEDGEPADTLVTLMLSDAPGGRTRMRFSHAFLKSGASVEGHRHGWSSSFDRLDDWIASGAREGEVR